MNIHNKNIVITGAANGIGYALAKRIIQESPKSISLIVDKSLVGHQPTPLIRENFPLVFFTSKAELKLK